MKRLLILPVLLFFAACSTDDTGLDSTNNINLEPIQENEFAGTEYKLGEMPNCNVEIEGVVYVDATNGMQNLVAVFAANVSGMSSKLIYKAALEIEVLSDCENFGSGNGTITKFNAQGYMQPPLAISPAVRLNRQSLPANACYRWRFVVEGYSSLKLKAGCVTVSDWYEAPLF